VIPCYNDAQFLPEAIASLTTEEPSELVVVDDGSHDPATIELLDALAAGGVRVLHQPNAGPAAARMTGVGATRAPHVLPLDADDLLAPGSVAALADALAAQPAAGMAWGDVELFSGDGRRLVARTPDTLDPWLITYLNELPLCALFRRDALVEAGGWRLRQGYEDWDLWMALAERGYRGLRVDRIVERHREHGARRWAADFAQHERSELVLRSRHPSLFEQRPQARRRSPAPMRLKLLLPLIERASFLSAANRYRLRHLAGHPLRLSRLRLQRLARLLSRHR